MGEEKVRVRVRELREAAKVRPGDLTARAGVTRQALHAIESGAYLPGVLVALRLARALGCEVEDLFALPAPTVEALSLGEVAAPARVQLAWVGERLLALPLTGERALSTPADGMATGPLGGGRVAVETFASPDVAQSTGVVLGCDPSLGLLPAHALRLAPRTRLLWRPCSSLEALRGVARGEAHAAGIHLWDAPSATSNLPAVERELPGRQAHLITLWSWEQGLIVARGNPKKLRGVGDLARGARLVNREEGAGSRLLLDAWLAEGGLSGKALPGYDRAVNSHLAVAEAIARGEADAGPGPRAAATALGLDFVAVQRERFDLVVPREHLAHPAIVALLNVVREDAFRAELSALGGYDPARAGELWQITA